MVAAAQLRVRPERRTLSRRARSGRAPDLGASSPPNQAIEPANRPRLRLRADAFVALAGDALVVRVGGRWSRVRTGDAETARTIHAALRRSGSVTTDLGEREVEAVGRLVETGALEPYDPPRLWDRLDVADRISAPATATATIDGEGRFVLLADRSDPALGPALVNLGRRAALLGLVAPGRVLVARRGDLDQGHGCPRCAWLGDRAQVSDIPPVQVEGAPAAFGARAWLAARCAQLVDAALLDLAHLPPGHAFVERVGSVLETHAIARHPACDCWRGASLVPDVTWETLAGSAFAPVWPVADGQATDTARVVFRRSPRGDVVSPATLGVALGAGPQRTLLALSESIERSAMHHGPPEVVGAAVADLDGPPLPAMQIESLLFREEERSAPGFRFPAFDPSRPIHWSRARALGVRRTVLVPTALVGHVPAEQRIVPATSNGFACHTDERAAMLGALLELVERDALLLSWFLGRPWQRLTDVDDSVGATFLCTQDIDLPVVFACACAEDGSLRSGSAAAIELGSAVERAHAERAVALDGRPSPTVRAGLERVDVMHGPEDHLARVAGPAGRVAYDALRAQARDVQRTEVERWVRTGDDPLETVARALADRDLEAWIADRAMPAVFGPGWRVVRAIVPGLVELSFGPGYRRLASPRIAAALAAGETLNPEPHPFG